MKRTKDRIFTKKHCAFAAAALLAFFAAMLVSKYYIQLMLIQGSSMAPTYHNLSLVVLDKHTREYRTGDIIAFTCDGVRGTLVKRIVAEPSDTVWIREGVLYVNGIQSSVQREKLLISDAGLAGEPITLADNVYFVLGDNYENSIDSRFAQVGPIEAQNIIGKVIR